MKIIERTSEIVERIGDSKEHDFKIKPSQKAFEILSKQIYTNPITPPIRELATNAHDSHVEAQKRGKKVDRPFEVHLPSILEPWFSVRDFGVGMSEEEIETIYTTYFESTKTESNDYVGCLGLGSKSPFCYTDTFSVISIQNGVMLTYTAFLENGVPKIAQLDKSDTDNPDGMLIQFGVDENDIPDFIRGAKEIYNRFLVRPKILGYDDFKYEEYEYEYRGDGWAIRKNQSGGSYAVMGNIAYPINSVKLNYHTQRKYSDEHVVIDSGVDLIFDIGQLEIAANRESLYFDDRTIRNITLRAQAVFKDLEKFIQNKIENCKTLWDARCMYAEVFGGKSLFGSSIQRRLSSKIYSFNGYEIRGSYVSLHDIASDNSYSRSYTINKYLWARPRNNYRGEYKARRREETNIHVDKNVVFMENDLPTGGISRISHFIEKNQDKIVYSIDGIKDNTLLQSNKTISKTNLLKYIGYPKSRVVKTSSLPKAPKLSKSKRSTGNLRKVKKYIKGAPSWYNWSDRWNECNIDVTADTCYYIQTNHREILNPITKNEDSFTQLNSVISVVEKLDSKFKGFPVYGIPTGHLSRFKKLPNWVNLYEYASKLTCDYLKKNQLELAYKKKKKISKYSDEIETLRLIRVIPEADNIYKKIREWQYDISLKEDDFDILIVAIECLGYKLTEDKSLELKAVEVLEEIRDKYPMLKYINIRGSIGDEFLKDIEDYINLF